MSINTENKPRETLKNILKQYGPEGVDQIGLGYKYKIHIDLSEKYPYLEDGTLDEDYVKECTDKAIEVYKDMKFSNNLLVVYDDMLNEHSLEEKKFLESNLENIERYDKYNYKWQYPDDDGELICKRYVYKVGKVNIKRLFKEIILSDIGGKLDLVSSIYIIDINRKHIFYLYDDRGLFIYALGEKYLLDIWEKFYNYVFKGCDDFKIEVKDLYWINKDKDNPNDLCLHGDIVVTMGEEELSYIDATVSASAMRILKTLKEDHIQGEGKQMLPCCGNTMTANENIDEVEIIGCDNGIDWTVLHDNGMIKIITESGNTLSLYYLQYKKEVIDFANIIENYYKRSSPKVLPEDEFDRNGYLAFWNEWNRRMGNEKRI